MRAIKSIVRWLFGLQAAVLILSPIVGIFAGLITRARVNSLHVGPTHAHRAPSLLAGYGLLAAAIAIGAVFAMAWWTSRKPSAQRNLWALAASLIFVAEGVIYFVFNRRAGHSGTSGLDLVAAGLVGLFVFLRRENVPDSTVTVRKRAPIAGDRTSAWTRDGVTAFAGGAQIAAIFVWGRWAFTHELFRARGLTWLALVAITSVLTTIIHECGHALIAWCFEMGLLSFKAGPFQWAKREGNWKFRFHAAGLLTPGGAVGAVPTNPEQPRWEEILVIFAGPFANLLIAGPAIWAVLHDSWASYQHTWEFVAFTGSFCLIAAVLNLVPFMSEEGSYSDGARILQILTHSPLDDYHRTMASIASTVVTARRYRDLDIAAIERAASLFPNEFRGMHLHLCASQFYEDSGRLPEASCALAAAEAIYNKFSIEVPGPLHTIFVIGHAYLNRDATGARLWWDRMESKKCEHSSVGYWFAKTALHWIEGNLQEAEEAWQKADSEAQDLPRFGTYEFDRLRCAMLREALDDPSRVVDPAPTSAPIAIRTAATASRPTVAQSAPAATRAASAKIPEPIARPTLANPPQNSIAPTADYLFDPLARLFPVSSAPTPSTTPATAVVTERLPLIHAPVAVTAEVALPIAQATTVPLAVIEPVTIARATIDRSLESNLLPPDLAVARGPASFTRIPASAIVVAEAPSPRLAVPVAGSATPAIPSTGVPPSLKAPAVPAAFARRAVRPVPAPPSNPYAETAVDAATAPPASKALETPALAPKALAPALASESAVFGAYEEAVATIAKSTAPAPPPKAAPSIARFDPLEFIRAAALENLPT